MSITTTVSGHVFIAQTHTETVALGTTGLSSWIKDNVIPVVLLVIAVIMLFASGKGDLAKLFKIGGGALIALAFLGIAIGGNATSIGDALSKLFN